MLVRTGDEWYNLDHIVSIVIYTGTNDYQVRMHMTDDSAGRIGPYDTYSAAQQVTEDLAKAIAGVYVA